MRLDPHTCSAPAVPELQATPNLDLPGLMTALMLPILTVMQLLLDRPRHCLATPWSSTAHGIAMRVVLP